MPPKKGLATTKKVEKYVYLDTDSEKINPIEDDDPKHSGVFDDRISPVKQPGKRS